MLKKSAYIKACKQLDIVFNVLSREGITKHIYLISVTSSRFIVKINKN